MVFLYSFAGSKCVCRTRTLSLSLLRQTHIIMNTLIYDVVNTQFYCDIVLFECFHNFSFASKSCLVIFGIFSIQHSNRYTQRTSIHITSLSLSHMKTLHSFDRAAKKMCIYSSDSIFTLYFFSYGISACVIRFYYLDGKHCLLNKLPKFGQHQIEAK